MRRWLALAALSVALPVLVPSHAHASQFVLRAGSDTVTVEHVTRTHDRLDGGLLLRVMGLRIDFTLALAPDGSARSIHTVMARTGGGQAATQQVADVAFTGDSAIATLTPGGVQRFATRPGVVPYLNPSMAMIEQAVHRARALGHDSTDVPVFFMSGGRTVNMRVVSRGADSVLVDLSGVVLRLAVNAAGDVTGGTIPVQHIEILRSEGEASSLAISRTDYGAPAGAPYRALDVHVPTPGGFELAGTLTLPKGAGARVPCIVTITGSGLEDRDEALPMVPNYRPFRQIADALGRRGIAVLRLDDRGYGESGGDPTHATTADFAEDLRAALKWLRQRPDIDASRLGLLGHSEGALIAPMVAASDPQLRAIVLLAAPSRTGRRVMEYQNRFAAARDPSLGAAARDSMVATAMRNVDSLAVGSPWLKWFLEHDPLDAARHVKQPVLIVQGGNDRQVEPVQANELAAALRSGGNANVTVKLLPGLNHLLLPDPSGDPLGYSDLKVKQISADVLAMIAEWTAAQLK